MFHDERLFPYKANILLFDSSGEYYNAFRNLNEINSNYNYRFYSTNEMNNGAERLRIPVFLLNVSDLALLLQVTNHSQLPIIERMLKLALVFSQSDKDATDYKNYLIAKAIMTVLYTNETAPNKRNEIFSILASCSTPQFNLEAVVQGVGYKRKFRECFLIDNQGQFSESVLLTEYGSSFIKSEYESYEPENTNVYYSLETLEKALNFTLISEGWLRNENTYADAITLKVRLHSLIIGPNAKFFDYSDYISLETYLSTMLIDNGRKYQLVNINLDDVDDDFAKVITKIFSRLIFDFSKGLPERASIPFHIIIEEAHRYVQNDTDRFLLGYNIFERIAKEGRKYGVVLGLVTQRPVELSETVISQCANFLIFKMNHPVDVEYIRKMVPNISDEIVEKQKSLQSGTCLGFGLAFRIPLIVKMEMPDPSPWSANCDVVTIWNGNTVSKPIQMKRPDEIKVVPPKQINVQNGFNQAIQNDLMSGEKINSLGDKARKLDLEKNPQIKIVPPDEKLVNRPSLFELKKHKDEVNADVKKSKNSSVDIQMPVVPTGSSIEMPKIPKGMSPENTTVTKGEFVKSTVSGDASKIKKPSNTIETVESNGLDDSDEGFVKISNGMDSDSNWLQDLVGQKEMPDFGNFEVSNVQSAIPDFTMTSAQERELSIPTNSYSIPSSYSMINQNTVMPTVEIETDDDFGKVTLAPPDQSDKPRDAGASIFTFSNKNDNGVPTTETGMPLINLVG